MKIAVMCDMHMPERTDCVQYDYFFEAVEDIKQSGAEMTITIGDISAIGENIAFETYKEKMKDIPNITILGNSDVRSGEVNLGITFGGMLDCGRNILCVNDPYAKFSQNDMDNIASLKDGDIVMMHHSLAGLCEESRVFLKKQMSEKALIIIHAHSHNFQDYKEGKSRVICVRALDPEKSIGDLPCITYLDVDDTEFALNEKCFATDYDKISDFRDYLGISCFDVRQNFDFAIDNNIKNLELRKYSREDGLMEYTIKKVTEWRNVGGRALSIHMPNVRLDGDRIDDSGWDYAKELLIATDVDSVTIHPPRVSVEVFERSKEKLFDFYAEFAKSIPEKVKIGFENLHMNKGEQADNNRGFGYIPDEVMALADGVNARIGYKRVGLVLDVGHARNNPPYNSKFTHGMWYSIIGQNIVAYHIHQVERVDGKLINHAAIKNWFGAMISYAAFFRAWGKGQINRVPAFWEKRELEQAQQSIQAFDNTKRF